MWQNWVNVILGIWLIISPFVLTTGAQALMWNNIIVGIVVAIVAYLATSAK